MTEAPKQASKPCLACLQPSSLQCPQCLKLELSASFCGQACFKRCWPTHKLIHEPAAGCVSPAAPSRSSSSSSAPPCRVYDFERCMDRHPVPTYTRLFWQSHRHFFFAWWKAQHKLGRDSDVLQQAVAVTQGMLGQPTMQECPPHLRKLIRTVLTQITSEYSLDRKRLASFVDPEPTPLPPLPASSSATSPSPSSTSASTPEAAAAATEAKDDSSVPEPVATAVDPSRLWLFAFLEAMLTVDLPELSSEADRAEWFFIPKEDGSKLSAFNHSLNTRLLLILHEVVLKAKAHKAALKRDALHLGLGVLFWTQFLIPVIEVLSRQLLAAYDAESGVAEYKRIHRAAARAARRSRPSIAAAAAAAASSASSTSAPSGSSSSSSPASASTVEIESSRSS